MYIKILRRLILGFILSILIFFSHPQSIFSFADPIGSWSNTTNLPSPLASHISYTSANKISVVGGANTVVIPTNISSVINNADGSLLPWISSGSTLSLFWHSSAIKDNFLYVLGGATFPPTVSLNTVYKGVIDNQGVITSWTSLTPLPQNLSIGSSTVVGTRLYFAGGFTNGGSTNQNVYFANINADGTIGSWTIAGLLPEPMSGFGMVENGNNLIIIGGQNSAGIFLNKTYKSAINAGGTLGGWQDTTSLLEPVYRSGVIRIGSTLLSIGGFNGSVLDKIYYANINADATLGPWTLSSNHLPQPVCCGAVAVSNSYLYLTGGFNGAYLNTVYYAPLNVSEGIDLPVPYFSQNVLPWGPTEYDHANVVGLSDPDFERWGCAVTSAAMVLNYHNMMEFEDDTPIDPGSLNEWLKNNNGFQTSKPGFGKPFSKFVWSSINILSGELYEASKSAYKLEHVRYSAESTESSKLTVLNDDLTNKQNPAILAVSNALTNMHFVVAKGVENGLSYLINDPEWNYENLAPFGNDFFQLDRYKRATSNASYIEMSTNEGIEIAVVDSEGRKTGKQVVDGVIQTFDEIPNAVYSHQNAISNPNSLGEQESLGFGFNEFLLPEPLDGQYTIILSSFENQTYTLNIAALEANGDDQNFQMAGIIGQNSGDEFDLDYSQDEPSVLGEIVTFDSLINDINSLRATGDISNFGVYVSLLSKADVAKGLGGNIWTNRASINLLKSMQKEITKQKGKGVSDNAFNILNADIQSLISSFSP